MNVNLCLFLLGSQIHPMWMSWDSQWPSHSGKIWHYKWHWQSTSFSCALTIGLTCCCFKYLLRGSNAMVSVCHSAALLLKGSFWNQNFQRPWRELYWYLFRGWNPQSSEPMQLHKLSSPHFLNSALSATIRCGQEDILGLECFWSLPFCWDSAQCKGWPDAKGAGSFQAKVAPPL